MTAGQPTAAVPPGRAGRMWLRRRLGSATRGREQLDRKLQVLLPEQRRLHAHAERCHREWDETYDQARTWLLRASLLGGQDALRRAEPSRDATFEIVWDTVMGLRIPSDVSQHEPDESSLPADNVAVPAARAAYRSALEAAIRVAAADAAERMLDDEVATCRRRLRALDRRWIPWLSEQLRVMQLALDDLELDDGTRLRRAAALKGRDQR